MAETQITELFPSATVADGTLSIDFADLPGLTTETTDAEKIMASIIAKMHSFFTEAKRVGDRTKSVVVEEEIRISAEPFYNPVTNLIMGNDQVQEFTVKFYKEMTDTTFNPQDF
jgi:ribosomal protein L31